jgi:hypothetical protein
MACLTGHHGDDAPRYVDGALTAVPARRAKDHHGGNTTGWPPRIEAPVLEFVTDAALATVEVLTGPLVVAAYDGDTISYPTHAIAVFMNIG